MKDSLNGMLMPMQARASPIDLNETYFFRARTQGSQDNVIQSVTLTTTSAQFEAPIVTTSASTVMAKLSFPTHLLSAILLSRYPLLEQILQPLLKLKPLSLLSTQQMKLQATPSAPPLLLIPHSSTIAMKNWQTRLLFVIRPATIFIRTTSLKTSF